MFALFFRACFRISVTANCYMDLQNYPIDSQLCSLLIQSCKLRPPLLSLLFGLSVCLSLFVSLKSHIPTILSAQLKNALIVHSYLWHKEGHTTSRIVPF